MIEKSIRVLGALVSILGATLSPTWPIWILTVGVGLLVIAYTLHSVREPVHELIHRLRPRELIPLVELRKMATNLSSNHSLEILDLRRAVEEAGLRGLLIFYGRRYEKDNTFPDLALLIPRSQIPKEEWHNLQLGGDTFSAFQVKEGNFGSSLQKRTPIGDPAYRDIWVRRRGVRRWFRKYAREFRGQYAQQKVKASVA